MCGQQLSKALFGVRQFSGYGWPFYCRDAYRCPHVILFVCFLPSLAQRPNAATVEVQLRAGIRRGLRS